MFRWPPTSHVSSNCTIRSRPAGGRARDGSSPLQNHRQLGHRPFWLCFSPSYALALVPSRMSSVYLLFSSRYQSLRLCHLLCVLIMSRLALEIERHRTVGNCSCGRHARAPTRRKTSLRAKTSPCGVACSHGCLHSKPAILPRTSGLPVSRTHAP